MFIDDVKALVEYSYPEELEDYKEWASIEDDDDALEKALTEQVHIFGAIRRLEKILAKGEPDHDNVSR